MVHHLFIYGSLKRGHVRAPLLAGQRFLGEVRTAARYRLIDLGPYPGLVEADRPDVDRPGVAVRGELWAVDAARMPRLDAEEDVAGGEYERKRIALRDDDLQALAMHNDDVLIEAYFYCGSVAHLPDCGSVWPAPVPSPFEGEG